MIWLVGILLAAACGLTVYHVGMWLFNRDWGED